jgi:hypothetical protein
MAVERKPTEERIVSTGGWYRRALAARSRQPRLAPRLKSTAPNELCIMHDPMPLARLSCDHPCKFSAALVGTANPRRLRRDDREVTG